MEREDIQLYEEIDEWAYTLPSIQVNKMLIDLDMRVGTSRLENVCKLARRLRGDYTATDFVQTSEPEFLATSRRHATLHQVLQKTLTMPMFLKQKVIELHRENRRNMFDESTSTLNGITPIVHTTAQTFSTPLTQITPPRHSTPPIQTNTPIIRSTALMSFTDLETTTTTSNTLTTTTSTTVTTTPPVCYALTQVTASADYLARRREQERKEHRLRQSTAEDREATLQARIDELEKLVRNLSQQQTLAQPVDTSRQVQFQDTFGIQWIRPNAHSTQNGQQRPEEYGHNLQDTINNTPNNPDVNSGRRGGLLGTPGSNYHPDLNPRVTDRYSTQPLPGTSINTLADTRVSQWQNNRRDIGKVARDWNIKFDGETNSCIEDFLQRVNECRVSSHLSDEDSLNAMLHVLNGRALVWCRQLRHTWFTWNDFCKAARRSYGMDQDVQMKLLAEAQARTQGKREPVRDHIFAVLAILSRLSHQPPLQSQLSLIYDNMLPEIQMLVPKGSITNLDALIEKARAAEQLLHKRDNYKPPPPPERCLYPQLAYQERAEPRPKAKITNISAVAEPINVDNLSTVVAAAMKEAVAAIMSAGGPTPKPKNSKAITSGEKGKTWRKSKPKENTSVVIEEVTDDPKKSPRDPRRERNKDRKPAGSSPAPVRCYGCGWPGHISRSCPDCSKNQGKEQGPK